MLPHEKTYIPKIFSFYDVLSEAIAEEFSIQTFVESIPENVFPSLFLYYQTIESVLNDACRENTAIYVVNYEYREVLKTKSMYTVLDNAYKIFMGLRNAYTTTITATSRPGKKIQIVFAQDRIAPILTYDGKERPVVLFQVAYKVDLIGSVL